MAAILKKVQVYKAIFQSPGSAKGPIDENEAPEPSSSKRASRHNVTQIIGIKEVTSRTLAYAAVQVEHPLLLTNHTFTIYLQLLFALSDAPMWLPTNRGFSYHNFYNFIVDYLKVQETCEDGDQIRNLFQWWNQ